MHIFFFVTFEFQTQARKLANYIDLEKEVEKLKEENTRLKDEVKNKLILEEEVHDLKSRQVNYKEQEKKLAHLQAQQVQTELHLDEWRSVARGICETTGSDSSLPHLLRSAVERLQQQEISLTSAKVELDSQLTAAQYVSINKIRIQSICEGTLGGVAQQRYFVRPFCSSTRSIYYY
jgi:hypothetical protein